MADASDSELINTTWTAKADTMQVNSLKIVFGAPYTCTYYVGSDKNGQACSWSRGISNGQYLFGVAGGSVSLTGTVSGGSGKAQGFAAGSAIGSWTLTKQS